MLERTLVSDAVQKSGETISISGWISVRRDHGKLVFFELRDRSGHVQLIVTPEKTQLIEAVKDIRAEYAVRVEGIVKERPAKKGTEESALSTDRIEIEVTALSVVGKPSEDLPIDVSQPEMNLQLETLLNNRTVALRNPKVQAIFEVYDALLESYEDFMRSEGFLEIKTPKILSSATEGGANFFKIKYFDRDAYLAQSPQFYKQAGMSAFERVFEIGSVFRAEPHYTTRHVNEYTGLDAEMGFIDSVEDVMSMLERTMRAAFDHIGTKASGALTLYGVVVPKTVPIPRLRLSEAIAILEKEYGKKTENEDIDSEGERLISEYIEKQTGSELVFLTHYPVHIRPFYSQPSPDDPGYTETFDLLFRGLEIASGGQRIHDYAQLKANIETRGLDPESFKDYLDIFKYGAPPHGGWGLGSERIVQKLFGLSSIKEAILYPRDVKRIAP
jgi:nondiscriminating aspartyl-tRNA synthetase